MLAVKPVILPQDQVGSVAAGALTGESVPDFLHFDIRIRTILKLHNDIENDQTAESGQTLAALMLEDLLARNPIGKPFLICCIL